MIEGVKIDVTSVELEDHLKERAKHHDDKRVFYEKQAASLKEGDAGQVGVSNDPVSSLENSARHHREASGLFQFLADHVIPDETYRLEERDLTRLELVSRYF